MAGSVKNYRRFYAAFKKVPHYGDEEEQKEALVSTYTKGRTSHLREMTTREYTDMCKALDKGMEIESIHLDKKTGGKSGTYLRKNITEK